MNMSYKWILTRGRTYFTGVLQVLELQMVVGAVLYHQPHSMVSNETVLMCGEASVMHAPLCIGQSTQISSIEMGQFFLRGMYVLLEISWGDYVLYYILKYIPTYVRMDWPNTTTRQTHTKGPNFFTKLFVDITHTHTSNILAFGGTGSPRGRVSFSG